MKTVSFAVSDPELYRKFREVCSLKGIRPYRGVEAAMRMWVAASTDGDIFSLPPYNVISPSLIEEFRRRCAKNKLDMVSGIAKAMVTWIHNLSFTEPYPPPKHGNKHVKDDCEKAGV